MSHPDPGELTRDQKIWLGAAFENWGNSLFLVAMICAVPPLQDLLGVGYLTLAMIAITGALMGSIGLLQRWGAGDEIELFPALSKLRDRF